MALIARRGLAEPENASLSVFLVALGASSIRLATTSSLVIDNNSYLVDQPTQSLYFPRRFAQLSADLAPEPFVC